MARKKPRTNKQQTNKLNILKLKLLWVTHLSSTFGSLHDASRSNVQGSKQTSAEYWEQLWANTTRSCCWFLAGDPENTEQSWAEPQADQREPEGTRGNQRSGAGEHLCSLLDRHREPAEEPAAQEVVRMKLRRRNWPRMIKPEARWACLVWTNLSPLLAGCGVARRVEDGLMMWRLLLTNSSRREVKQQESREFIKCLFLSKVPEEFHHNLSDDSFVLLLSSHLFVFSRAHENSWIMLRRSSRRSNSIPHWTDDSPGNGRKWHESTFSSLGGGNLLLFLFHKNDALYCSHTSGTLQRHQV